MSGMLDRLMAELAFDGGWHLVSDNTEMGVRKYVSVQMVNDKYQIIVKTENYAIGLLIDKNAAIRADLAGKKHGDWSPIASVPVDIWQREVAEAFDQGDDKYVNRWFNDGDHAAFRTREGTV